jgi:hypothetical protein
MNIYNKLIELYQKELDIPNNEICKTCDSSFKQPLLPWNIGEKYFTEKGRIFIAGKPHRGTPGNLIDNTIIDGRARGKELFLKKNWPYWNYTKIILNNIFHSSEESWKHIAFSNVVKCTSTNNQDKTSLECAEHCIIHNKVIFKEIELLQPRKVLFFTWHLHRHLFKEIPFAKTTTIIEHTNINFKKDCGAKKLGWWERSFMSTWNTKVDFLIVGHPERMKKEEYVNLITEWLQKP